MYKFMFSTIFLQVWNLKMKRNEDHVGGIRVTNKSRETAFRPLSKYCNHQQKIEGISLTNERDTDWNKVLAVIVINTEMASDYTLVSKKYNEVFRSFHMVRLLWN